MPEGPSIVILKELVQKFKGKKISKVSGNAKIDMEQLRNQIVVDFKSFGKQFLICFENFTVRIHLLMFGSYLINEEKNTAPRLSLKFKNGTLNFYSCSVRMINVDLDTLYDWSVDVMSDSWNAAQALKKLKSSNQLVCDALLDQEIFAGVGNIIKNEVLFRVKIHPQSIVKTIPLKQLKLLIEQIRVYSFQFLEWKKVFELKKHWLAHTKKICPRDHIPFSFSYLGKTHRRSFFCEVCQKLYKP